ncbi:hypothetical protein PIB30_040006 [Stylosanthes scabra]|uniref:Uncharacterized protein n=1 Tax=Stylosanthes scabra TaxID=79078 RepID=A0ABU6YF95_9FABA|nr:hypothetical protein [Stylosanthes scabra]
MKRSHQKILERVSLGCHISCHVCLTRQQPGGHVAEPDWVQQATSATVKGESTRGLQNGSVTGWRFGHGSRAVNEARFRVERRVSGTGRESDVPDQIWKGKTLKRRQGPCGGVWRHIRRSPAKRLSAECSGHREDS